MLYATLVAIVVRRAGNVIGWFLLGIGAGLAISTSASAYAVLGITHRGTPPAPELAVAERIDDGQAPAMLIAGRRPLKS